MAIEVDNSGVGQRVSSGDTNTLVDFVVGSGNDRVLLAMTNYRFDGVEDTESVVFNGDEYFTEIARVVDSILVVQLWCLVNPTNITADIVATSSSTLTVGFQLAAASYTGVRQENPTNYATGTNSDWVQYGIDIATDYVDSMVWGGIGSFAPNLAPIEANYTLVYADDDSCGLFVESRIVTTTGTYSLTWISEGATDSGLIHVEIREAPPVVLDQEGFRWRNDDDDEVDATWRQLQDVVDSVARATTIRLRVLINATDNPDTAQFKLEYKRTAEGGTEYREVKV